MIGILGIIFVIVAPIFIYRSAKQNGHKPVFWTLIALAVGIGFQIIVPMIVGIILAVVLVGMGHSPNSIEPTIQGYSLIIGLPCLILSFVGVFLVMRRVNKAKKSDAGLPPAPPEF